MTGLLATGCCGSSSSADNPTLPEAGADARFAGTYSGSGTYVASLAPNSFGGNPAIGDATGVLTTSVSIDDDTTNPMLSADAIVVHLGQGGAGTCDVPGTVTARRYDPSGGYVQLPLTVASAKLASDSACALPVDGGTAHFLISTSDVKLFADGSLELSVAGSVKGWPNAVSASGEVEVSFFGQR